MQHCSACLRASSRSVRQAGLLAGPPKAFSTSALASNSEASSSQTSDAPPKTATKPPSQSGSKKPPPLPRPLGVLQPPGRHVKPSLRQRAENMMSTEARMAERKHIVKEASTGYFEDYNKLRHEGGKLWVAPKTLIQEKAARYFPEIQGNRLVPPPGSTATEVHTSDLLKGKISLVAMLSTRISEAHIETYTRNILDSVKGDPLFQFVQINMQENKLKWALLSLFLSSLRRSVPEEYRSTYLVSTQSLEYLKEPMGMSNKHPGYIYLVDENCKIRWAAVSFAQTQSKESQTSLQTVEEPQPVDEVQALASCIHVLLQRYRDGKV